MTGEGLLRPGVPPEETMYSFEEIAVAVDEAHKRNRQIAAHVRGNDGVKLCVEAGVDVIEHATYADDEAVEMIAERKDDALRRARPRLPLGHPREGRRLRHPAGGAWRRPSTRRSGSSAARR